MPTASGNPDAVADRAGVDAVVVELAEAAAVQAHADAIDLAVALVATFDAVADDRAARVGPPAQALVRVGPRARPA